MSDQLHVEVEESGEVRKVFITFTPAEPVVVVEEQSGY